MTTEEKTLLAMLTLVTVLVPVALGVAFGWPAWSWLLLAVPLLIVLGLVVRHLRQGVRQELRRLPYATLPSYFEQPNQAPRIVIADVDLQSADTDYDFHFSATAYWRPARGSRMQHTDPGAVAADAIVARARTIAAAEQPDKVDIVARRLASALGAAQPDASGGVEVWADQVQLTLSEADQEWLRKFSDKRKDKNLWERERDLERLKREYLSKDVLQSTGSAVTWCLARKDNDVEDTVRLVGVLAVLCAAVNDTEVPEPFRHLVPTAAAPGGLPFMSPHGDQRLPNSTCPDGSHQTGGFPWAGFSAGTVPDLRSYASRWGAWLDTLGDFSDEHRAQVTHFVARLLDTYRKPDAAQEIRRHFCEPVTDEEPADLPEPDGVLGHRSAPGVEPPRQDDPTVRAL